MRSARRQQLRSIGASLLEFHRILLVVFTMAIGIVVAGLVSPPSAGEQNSSPHCAAPHVVTPAIAAHRDQTTGTTTAFNERAGGSS